MFASRSMKKHFLKGGDYHSEALGLGWAVGLGLGWGDHWANYVICRLPSGTSMWFKRWFNMVSYGLIGMIMG